jgi:hypothetical protein
MKNLLFRLFTIVTITTYAQVGIGTTTPDASSILELESTTQGMLTPRMDESQRDAITSPATGLLIYQTDNTPGFYYYNGTAWVPFGGTDNDWTISGNDMYNANTGNVGVGNTAPSAQFHVTGTASGGSGGTTTILSQDFESSTLGFVTGTVSTNEYQTTAAGGTEVWGVVDVSTDYVSVKCTNCTGQWIEIEYEFVDQDETFVSSQFSSSATATSLDITFDYRYRDYSLDATDTFTVILYNETDNAIASILIPTTSTSADTSYSGSYSFTGGNAPTDNYTIKFQYTGNGSYGASVDNIVVIENAVAAPASSVFRLEDGTEQAGYVLTSDANGNATWQAASGGGTDSQLLSISGDQLTISNGNTVTIPTGGGGGNSANNGLSISGSNVQLGGDLIKNTTINLDSYDLTFQTNPLSVFPGDIIFSGANRTVMETNLEDDYVNFGGGFPSVDSDDGVGFTDSGGDAYTRDFVWGAYKGSSGGTAIAMGSIEYFVDGLNELLFEGSGIHPLSDETSQFGNTLGASSRRWGAVYATNGVITTSDIRYKKNIKPLQYGLNEIMKLETISYNWRDNTVGKTTIPDNLTKKKIGFSAQQLLEVLPEVVQTHSWTTSDEEGNYKRIKNEKLGVYYSDVIPVAVKAIQEQQEQIQTLKSEVSELKELVNRLISEKN